MSGFIEYIKDYIKRFIENASKAEPIQDKSDYYRVEKWVKKVKKLYIVSSVIAAIASILIWTLLSKVDAGVPKIVYLLYPPLILLTCWGYAMLVLYLPDVVKSVLKSGQAGYREGEKHQTTHVQVTHEYGNNYRVSSYTEDKGCLFAFIAGMIRFMIWAFFCVYVAPFLNFKKLKKSIENLRAYSSNEA